LQELKELTELFMVTDLELDLSPVSHVDYINGQPNEVAIQ